MPGTELHPAVPAAVVVPLRSPGDTGAPLPPGDLALYVPVALLIVPCLDTPTRIMTSDRRRIQSRSQTRLISEEIGLVQDGELCIQLSFGAGTSLYRSQIGSELIFYECVLDL